MSTHATIFYTADGEHCYADTNRDVYVDDKHIGDVITMELRKGNVKVVEDSDGWLVIDIEPGSHLYEVIKSMKQKR